MALRPVVALDIGTSNVCALVGEAREDGNVMISGLGKCRSIGVRKGVILDIEQVAGCVGTAIEQAEESGSVHIRRVYLVVSGGHIQTVVNSGSVPVLDQSAGVTPDDVDEVKVIAGAVNLPHDREVIHNIPQKYSVDDQHDVTNPEGMHGAKLSLKMLIVHGARNLLNDAVKAVHSAGLSVSGVMFDGLCSALAVLTPEQRQCGVAVIDLGAGTSSYAVYVDDAVAAAGALGVGGDHVNNDIALGFNLSHKQADGLKRDNGSSALNHGAHFQQIAVPAEVGFSACSIAAADLNAVINARIDEIFVTIRKEFEKRNVLGRLAAGVVLTGGGAHLRGIDKVAGEVFDMPCVIGQPKKFSGMASVYEGPEFASAVGMVRHAAEQEADDHTRSIGGWMRRILHMRE